MAQHDQVIDNAPGLAVRTDINAALAALFSSNSGPVEPTVKTAGQLWFDTAVPASPVLRIRDAGNSAWIRMFDVSINQTFSGDITMVSTDPGAGGAPNFVLDRQSSSPASNDALGVLHFQGKDSGGTAQVYGQIFATIIDPTNGSEDGTINFSRVVAGTQKRAFYIDERGVVVDAGNKLAVEMVVPTAAGSDVGTSMFVSNGITFPNASQIACNAHLNAAGSAWKSISGSGYPGLTQYNPANGQWQWMRAAPTAAGGTVSWGSAMLLDANNTLYAAAQVNAGTHLYAAQNVYAIAGNMAMATAGSGRVLQFSPGWYLDWNAADGSLVYQGGGGWFFHSRAGDWAWIVRNAAYKPGGGAWADGSDIRIKNVIGDYAGGLAQILGLRPIRYRFKGNDTSGEPTGRPPSHDTEGNIVDDGDTGEPDVPYYNSGHYIAATTNQEFVGLVAQEAETVMPELVTQVDNMWIDGEKVTDFRNLDPGPLVFALINAVKELSARVVALEGKVPA